MISRIAHLKRVWQTVVGLEIHAQINSQTKLFSIAKNRFNASPNSLVAFFDMATPGTLPIINGRCVELALAAAVALKCEIDLNPEFDRKHYFYSDMPAGYQITQYRRPIARNGTVKFIWSESNANSSQENVQLSQVRITQVHIEQDSGKSLHDYARNLSLIDLNRAGVGLLEIVTDSQFRGPFDAAAFVKELKDILFDLGICTGLMEQGALRVDANVSVKPIGSNKLGERAEIKNIGSIKGVMKAIEFESHRQINVLQAGGEIINETRFYDPETESTFSMRDKEVLQDYRYYPEPNLSPLNLQQCCAFEDGICCHKYVCVQCAHKRLSNYVYPSAKRQLLTSKYSLSLPYANTLLNEPGLYSWLLSVSELSTKYVSNEDSEKWFKTLGNLSVTLLLGELRARAVSVDECTISPEKFAEFVTISNNKCTRGEKFHEILKILFDFPKKSPISIIKENKWDQISDIISIECIVRDFIKRHPKALNDHRIGKRRVERFFKKSIQAENNNLVDSKLLSDAVDRLLNE